MSHSQRNKEQGTIENEDVLSLKATSNRDVKPLAVHLGTLICITYTISEASVPLSCASKCE